MDMNEQDELFEQIDGRVHDIYLLGYSREGIPDSRNRIEQIIALVRADERKRIREAVCVDFNAVEDASDVIRKAMQLAIDCELTGGQDIEVYVDKYSEKVVDAVEEYWFAAIGPVEDDQS